jgi:hypothetical protein
MSIKGAISMKIDLSTSDRAREYLFLVAGRAAIALAHHVADDDPGINGLALRDLRTALEAYEETHRLCTGSRSTSLGVKG